MTVHVGIFPHEGTASYYNDIKKETLDLQIGTVDAHEIKLIGLMFEEIKSKINGKQFGCACICIDEFYGNTFRKRLIEEGIKYGFKNVEIINYETAIYLNAMSQIEYKPLNGNVIWIYDGMTIHVWQKNDPKAKFVGNWIVAPSKISDFEEIVSISKLNKEPDDVLYDDRYYRDIAPLTKIFSICQFFAYNKGTYGGFFSRGCLLKAQITVRNSNFKLDHLDVFNFLSTEITIKIGNEEIISFERGHRLPIIYSTKIIKKTKNDMVKFIKRMEEETIELPVSNNIYLILKMDANEIYYITITEHAKGSEEKKLHENKTSEKKPLDENKTSSTTNDISNASVFQNQQFSTVRFYNLSSKTDLSNKNINAVGIDLGTSRCCAAVRKKNGIETIALDNTGERLLPSFVAYDEEKVICGTVAVKRLRNSYKSTIYDSKRIIGRKINEIEIDSFWPFGLSEKSGKVHMAVQKFNVPDKTQIQGFVSPEEVAADLLKLIKKKAEEIQGTSLKNCVITVPAAFNDSQKAATIKAAEMAGWKDILLLPEPIAAAYFHGRPIPSNSNILVFDLGGGTLDVCIFKIKNGRLQVISNTGDSKFGGRDFDTVLINYFKNELSTKYGINLVKNKKYLLMIKCQEIKETLSLLTKANLDIDEFDTNQDGIISITQEEFEKMTQSLLNKVENTLIAALYKPKLYANQIDKVLLVGGGSRMPMIKDLLKEKFPKAEHCCHEHPDEVVAIGAAHYACSLQKPGDSGKGENCTIM